MFSRVSAYNTHTHTHWIDLRKWRWIPDSERKTVPDHKSGILKGSLPLLPCCQSWEEEELDVVSRVLSLWWWFCRRYKPQPAMRTWWKWVATSLESLETSLLEIPGPGKLVHTRVFVYVFACIPEGRSGIPCVLSPVWNHRALIWFPFTISSLVLLLSLLALSVLSFCCSWSILLPSSRKFWKPFSLKGRILCLAFIEQLGDDVW